jgi:P-type E1-E2 ATPase
VIIIFLADTETVQGYIALSDIIRKDSASLFDGLRADHIKRIIMLTGDKQHVAEIIARQIGITEVHAESLPEDKLRLIKDIPASDRPVVMVGDGINDAPALAAAEVGIGLATHGKTATSDSADVVLISSSLSRVRELLHIARHTLNVAKQGIWIGIGLSVICMIFAGFGFIKPVIGALMQEGIDVLVILNALRVARGRLPM